MSDMIFIISAAIALFFVFMIGRLSKENELYDKRIKFLKSLNGVKSNDFISGAIKAMEAMD